MTQAILSSQVRNNLTKWLDTWRFRANPFSEYRADQETDRGNLTPSLPDYFVETSFYEEIISKYEPFRTMLIYAARGSGKTAHRIMASQACRPTNHQSPILAINYNDFGELPEVIRKGSAKVTSGDHAARILGLGSQVFLEVLLQDSKLVDALGPQSVGKLKSFFMTYNQEALSASSIWNWLKKLAGDKAFDTDWEDFLREHSKHRLIRLLKNSPILEVPSARFLVALSDVVSDADAPHISPANHLAVFEKLVLQSGLSGIYVFLDGLDETEALSTNTDVIVSLLSPLLSDLTLLRRKHTAFKVFLPLEIQDKLAARPGIRHALLHPCQIVWQDNLLKELLEVRLIKFSDGNYSDLAQLCDKSSDSTITRDIVRHSQGVPRNLLRLGEALLLAHAFRGDNTNQLTIDDWKAALVEYYDAPEDKWPESPLPPLLRFEERQQTFILGGRPIRLSDAPYTLLKFLHGHSNRLVTYLELSNQTGLTMDNIQKITSRIRQKIEPDPKKPIYLITEHGRGLRLEHVG